MINIFVTKRTSKLTLLNNYISKRFSSSAKVVTTIIKNNTTSQNSATSLTKLALANTSASPSSVSSEVKASTNAVPPKISEESPFKIPFKTVDISSTAAKVSKDTKAGYYGFNLWPTSNFESESESSENTLITNGVTWDSNVLPSTVYKDPSTNQAKFMFVSEKNPEGVVDQTYHEKTHASTIIKHNYNYYVTHILTSCKKSLDHIFTNLGSPNYKGQPKDQHISALVYPRIIESEAIQHYKQALSEEATNYINANEHIKHFIELSAEASIEGDTMKEMRRSVDSSVHFNEAGQRSQYETNKSDYTNDVD